MKIGRSYKCIEGIQRRRSAFRRDESRRELFKILLKGS